MNARKAIGLCFFCAGLVFASWASRIPDIKQALGLTDGQLGSLLMGLPAGQLLTLPLSAYLESRFGSKNLARPGLLLYALMLVLTSQAPTPLTLALALFGMGSLGNITSISINTQGVLAEKQEGRTIMSTFHGLWSLAGFTGALLGLTMMWFHVSPARHFLFVWLLVFVLVQILHPHLIASGERKQKAKARFDKTLLPLGMIGFCSFATEGSAFMICMASGRLLGDRVIRRWGRLPVLGASGILMSTGLCLAILFPQLVPATLAFMMVGFGVSSVVPNVYSLAGSSPSVEPGVAIATVASMAYFGFLLGPPMIGYVSSVSSLRVSYGVIAILGLLIFQLRKNIQRA